MNVVTLLKFPGGIAFFLFGMKLMSTGLEKAAGGKLETLLERMTSSAPKGLLLGTGITVTIQSSSAVTVMLVGLVNSGIMTLRQTIPVIMGSNVGTTVTSWILSLSGINSDNLFITLLTPKAFSPVLAFLGLLLYSFAKRERTKNAGYILIGFSLLMYGMELMKGAVEPLTESEAFSRLLVLFHNPLLAIFAGAVFTAVIQSSSASVGVLQALAISVGIPYSVAVPLIVGLNIGTCITSAIAAIGVSKAAKRVVVIHLLFNIFGSLPFLAVYYLLCLIPAFPFYASNVSALDVAVIHSLLNVFSALLLMPFRKTLEKAAVFLVKDADITESEPFLDERLMRIPGVAVKSCRDKSVEMLNLAVSAARKSFSLSQGFDRITAEEIGAREKDCDLYRNELGDFLVKLCSQQLTARDSDEITKLLNCVTEFERISDYAVSILLSYKELEEKKLVVSPAAQQETQSLLTKLEEMLSKMQLAFAENDFYSAQVLKSDELLLSSAINDARENHIRRLKAGKCSPHGGIILSDLLNDFSRISSHCSNVASYVLRCK